MFNESWAWWGILTSSEKASWVQAWGSIAAIAVTAVLAGYAEVSRRLQERRQADISYKIACAAYSDIVLIVERATELAGGPNGSDLAIRFLMGAIDDRVVRNVDILQQLTLTPLPNSSAAKDVQRMRLSSFVLLAALKDCLGLFGHAEEIISTLALPLDLARFIRDVARDAHGPKRPAWWKFWHRPT